MYLTQKTKTLLIVGMGLLISLILTLTLFKLLDPAWNQMVAVDDNTSVDAVLLILLGAKALFGLAYLGFVIQGFRTHWGWGLANMLLPPSALVFFFVHTKKSKVPAIIYACGWAVVGLTMTWANIR